MRVPETEGLERRRRERSSIDGRKWKLGFPIEAGFRRIERERDEDNWSVKTVFSALFSFSIYEEWMDFVPRFGFMTETAEMIRRKSTGVKMKDAISKKELETKY